MTAGDLVAVSVTGGPGAAAEARRAMVAADAAKAPAARPAMP